MNLLQMYGRAEKVPKVSPANLDKVPIDEYEKKLEVMIKEENEV